MADVILKSMKLSRSEARKDTVEATEQKAPTYPWGLQYNLNEEVLAKLGDEIDDYEIGEVYFLYAKCKVIGKSEREYENSPKSMCVDLQITDLMIEDADAKPRDFGSQFYGEDE